MCKILIPSAFLFLLTSLLIGAENFNVLQKGFTLKFDKELIWDKDIFLATVFSSSGKMIAAGGCDDDFVNKGAGLKVWDVESGDEIVVLTAPKSFVTSVAFSPNEKMLAFACYDGTVRRYELKTRKTHLIPDLYGHLVDFASDGKILVVSSLEQKIRLWDMTTETVRATISMGGLDTDACPIAIDPSGKLLALGAIDRSRKEVYEVRIYDIHSCKIKSTLSADTGRVTSLTFSPNGQMLATGGIDGVVRLWDLRSRKEEKNFQAYSKKQEHIIASIAFSADGRFLGTGGIVLDVNFWDISSGNKVVTIKVPGSSSVAFSPVAKTLAITSTLAGTKPEVKLWKIKYDQ